MAAGSFGSADWRRIPRRHRQIADLVEGVGKTAQQRPARPLAGDEVEPAVHHVIGLAGHNPVSSKTTPLYGTELILLRCKENFRLGWPL